MAIVFVVLKWRPYLLGWWFVVRTDHESLKFLLEQQIVGVEYQKWISKLMGYQFDIQYRGGASNRVADALSRVSGQPECAALSIPQWTHWEVLRAEIEEDEFLTKIRQDFEFGSHQHVGFALENGLVYYKGRLVIP